MANVEVVQWIRGKEIKRRNEKVGAPQFALAHFAKISEANLSLVIGGRKMLSDEAQENINETLNFFEYLAQQAAPVPVDFGNLAALDRLFREYKKIHSASEVVTAE